MNLSLDFAGRTPGHPALAPTLLLATFPRVCGRLIVPLETNDSDYSLGEGCGDSWPAADVCSAGSRRGGPGELPGLCGGIAGVVQGSCRGVSGGFPGSVRWNNLKKKNVMQILSHSPT